MIHLRSHLIFTITLIGLIFTKVHAQQIDTLASTVVTLDTIGFEDSIKMKGSTGLRVYGTYTYEIEKNESRPRNVFGEYLQSQLIIEDGNQSIPIYEDFHGHHTKIGKKEMSYEYFIPYNALPYQKGEVSLRFILSFHESSRDSLPILVDTLEVRQLQYPALKTLKVTMGDFDVDKYHWKGRIWDRPFIFGNGVPEFFWTLYSGEVRIYASPYKESHRFPNVYNITVPYNEGDRFNLKVLEEDDIKEDFVGDYFFTASSDSLPIKTEKLSFGKISNARFHAREVRTRDHFLIKSVEIEQFSAKKADKFLIGFNVLLKNPAYKEYTTKWKWTLYHHGTDGVRKSVPKPFKVNHYHSVTKRKDSEIMFFGLENYQSPSDSLVLIIHQKVTDKSDDDKLINLATYRYSFQPEKPAYSAFSSRAFKSLQWVILFIVICAVGIGILVVLLRKKR